MSRFNLQQAMDLAHVVREEAPFLSVYLVPTGKTEAHEDAYSVWVSRTNAEVWSDNVETQWIWSEHSFLQDLRMSRFFSPPEHSVTFLRCDMCSTLKPIVEFALYNTIPTPGLYNICETCWWQHRLDKK